MNSKTPHNRPQSPPQRKLLKAQIAKPDQEPSNPAQLTSLCKGPAFAQILDAIKEYIPQTKGQRAASEFVQAVETVIIDARFEWYSVFNGQLSAPEIMTRWRNLAKLMVEIETKYFPDGLPIDEKRQKLAEAEAEAYFMAVYDGGGLSDE